MIVVGPLLLGALTTGGTLHRQRCHVIPSFLRLSASIIVLLTLFTTGFFANFGSTPAARLQ